MIDPFKTFGAFSWCELMTTDTDAARTFYTELFGWTIEEMPMGEMTYTVLKADGAPVGGIMPMAPAMPAPGPRWGSYVTVEDADVSAQKAEELGAEILVPPTDIHTVDRMFVFRDPQGAVLQAIAYTIQEGTA